MNRRYLTLCKALFALSDLLLLNSCILISRYFTSGSFNPFDKKVFDSLLASILIWSVCSSLFNLYSGQTLVRCKMLKRATLRSVILYLIVSICYIEIFRSSKENNILLLSGVVTLAFMISRAIYTLLKGLLIRFIDPDETINVFAIASIGGHWIQLLRLMPSFSTNEVSFISTKPSLEKTVSGHKYYLVPDANRKNKMNLIRCCMAIGAKILFARPQVIITTGAAPGLFGIFIGKIFGVKTVWIDSIANVEELSLSGKIASKIADRVYTQWEHLATSKIIFAGNTLDA